MGIIRQSWKGRGPLYTEYGISIRCVRKDQTAAVSDHVTLNCNNVQSHDYHVINSLPTPIEPYSSLLDRWQLYAPVLQEQAALLCTSHSYSQGKV